jgi:NitT/TauT family transport system permease protein
MISRAFSPLAFALLLLVAWQAIAVIGQIPEYLLPSPTAIIATVDRSLAVSFAVTFIEALAGFLIASVLAFAIATLFVRFQALEDGLFPIAIAVKTTPIVAIAPLLVIWLGTGWWSKIVAAMLICFFPVLVNTVKGLKAPVWNTASCSRRWERAAPRNSASCACLIVCPTYSRR